MTSDHRAVLVIDKNRKQLAWITRVVRTLARDVEPVDEIGESSALASRELIVANVDGLDDSERALLFGASADNDGPRIVLVSAALGDRARLVEALGEHSLSNLVAINGAPQSSELAITLRKLVSGDIFGLDKYFGWGVEAMPATITGSADGAHFVEHVTRYARRLDVHPRLVDQISTVADELVTNALFNAPVDDAGAPRFAHLPRTEDVELSDGEEIHASVACDGQWLGVCVSDPFGSLTRSHCIEYLVRGLRRSTRAPDAHKGGAGLGLYMTYDSLNHLAVNISAGRRTEVIGLVDVGGSYKQFANRGKSFNIFLESRSR